METGEAMDREVIIERAEALRGWLAGHGLSTRAAGALERELQGILNNDPGSYINGQRPLAGVTVGDFVSALHSRNAGVVGKVKNVGDAVIAELRATISADAGVAAPAAAAATDFELPELPALEEDETPVATDVAPASFVEEAPAAETAPPPDAEEAPRKRGRPKGSKNKPRVVEAAADGGTAEPATPAAGAGATLGATDSAAPAAPAPARRGRPRRVDTPAPASNGVSSANGAKAAPRHRAAAPVAAPPASEPAQAPSIARADQALDQLVRMWPSLHPHARRAVVLYASTLLAEAGFIG